MTPTKFASTNGVDIAFDLRGEGPPIVLVHGITDNRSLWDPVAGRLSADHQVVTLDLRGHGESGDASDYSALAMANDVAAVVAAAGIERPVLVGHSLGGIVVSAYAASGAPVAGVVNVDQSLHMSEFAGALRPIEPLLRGPEFHEVLSAIFTSMDGPLLSESDRAAGAERQAAARQDVVLGVWGLVFGSTDAELDAVIDAVAQAIAVPYLAIHGLDPGADYADWLSARIRGATVEIWPDHGHYLHLVDPDRFAGRVRRFAASLRG
jgi:pimeloyl-ACP methyl ester carboxylesterase